jgi:putative NADPH-quinone reductase
MTRKLAVAEHPEATRFDERLSFMVHRLHASLAQVAGRLLRAHDLDPVSSRILVLLRER